MTGSSSSLGSLESALDGLATRWEAASVLLARWRAHLPARELAPARKTRGEESLAWLQIEERAVAYFTDTRNDGRLTIEDRRHILAQTDRGLSFDAIDAVAWGLCVADGASFPRAWRETFKLSTGDPVHVLSDGEHYPVADAPWALAAGGEGRSPRPTSLTPPAVDELPNVRVHRQEEYEVHIDFSLEERLEAVAHQLRRVAALQLNETFDEFSVPEGQHIFGIRPRDEDDQAERITHLLASAGAQEADIAVLPELSVTPELVERIAHELDRLEAEDCPVPSLVVAGSYHATSKHHQQDNVATGLLPATRLRMKHRKVVPFDSLLGSHGPPSKEALDPAARPVLTIYQADCYRFTIAICKDALSDDVVGALSRVGANVVLVPAMSRTTEPFADRAGQLRANAQAVTLVANGPTEWDGDPVLPVAVFCQPYEQVGNPPAADPESAPALTCFEFRSANSWTSR